MRVPVGRKVFVLFVVLVTAILFVSDNLLFSVPEVHAGCSITGFSVNPGSPQQVGASVSINGSASCDGGVRAMRVLVDGNVISELGAPNIGASWNTSGASPGGHTISVEAAEIGDDNWSNAASQSTGYDLITPPPPQCSITSFNVSPPSPQPPGTTVSLSGSASCSTGVRAIRLLVNGNVINEIGAPDTSASWQAPGTGSYTLSIEAAGQGDDSWSHSATQSINYEIRVVDPGCTVDSVNASPSSPQPPGTTVNISGSATCANGSVRAMRIRVNGNIISEIGAPSISASWTAPNTPGSHTFTVEAAGQGDNDWAFADSKSMSYEISRVDPQCDVSSINASPSSPRPPGTTVTISGSATCANGSVQAMRISVDGSIISEIGAPNISASWTAPDTPGVHTFTVEAAGQGDDNWAFADSESMSYEIVGRPSQCKIDSIIASPPSPQLPGTTISISGSASCENGSVRAIRIKVDGNIISELGAPQLTTTWQSPGTPGTHTITVEAAGQGDNNWTQAASSSISYQIEPVTTVPPVQPQCEIQALTVDPPSPQRSGVSISIHGRATCNTEVRAIRFKIGDRIINELGASEASITWETPASPGSYTITVEAAGRGDDNWAYAASRSISYIVGTDTSVVDPHCTLTSLTVDPPSPQVPGTTVKIVAKGECGNGVRAIRIKVDGKVMGELGAPELSFEWKSPADNGTHRIEAEIAGIGDDQWEFPGRSSVTYVLGEPQSIEGESGQASNPDTPGIDANNGTSRENEGSNDEGEFGQNAEKGSNSTVEERQTESSITAGGSSQTEQSDNTTASDIVSSIFDWWAFSPSVSTFSAATTALEALGDAAVVAGRTTASVSPLGVAYSGFDLLVDSHQCRNKGEKVSCVKANLDVAGLAVTGGLLIALAVGSSAVVPLLAASGTVAAAKLIIDILSSTK